MICVSIQIVPDPEWWIHLTDPYSFKPIAIPKGNLSALIKEHVDYYYPPVQMYLGAYSPGSIVFKSEEDAVLFKLRLNINKDLL